MTTLLGRLDRTLGRLTMYRLVQVVLALLALYALILGTLDAFGAFEDPFFFFSLGAMLVSLAVALIATVGSTYLGALVLGVKPHPESSTITGLILWFLFFPGLTWSFLFPLALAGIFAGLSKFVLAWRGRHLMNPAAIGAVLVTWLGQGAPVWWVGSEVFFVPVLLGGLIVLLRTRRLGSIAWYVVPALVLTVIGYMLSDVAAWDAVTMALLSSQILFLGGFMLSEPLTQAPRAIQRAGISLLIALLSVSPLFISALPETLGRFTLTPELSLVIGNLVAFALGQRRGLPLRLLGRREVSPGVHEFTFDGPSLKFRPGQYLELHLPHRSDGRGTRRVFSLVDAPGRNIVVSTRVPGKPSSFKRALLDLKPGDTLRATAVAGDFLLPTEDVPVVLIAGGIGITPFLSQVRSGAYPKDTRLVYAAPSAADLTYLDELAVVPGVAVCPDRPNLLPPGWDWVQSGLLDADALHAAVPDLTTRRVFVSGPPVMVAAIRGHVHRAGARHVHTDAFTGY